ncbi:MAG: putative metal-binding motif-containing protein, partial [Myxococcota bacterium]|nr:putative metal-binding motif-containing protein [Myxococcota bacterium]
KVGEECTAVGECGEGTVECDGDSLARCSTNPGGSEYAEVSSAEICDGKDNDCDGKFDAADEDLVVPADHCVEQVGVCKTAETVCEDGDWICDVEAHFAYEQGAETQCDNLDNDCDGATDEADFMPWVGSGPQPDPYVKGGVCGSVICSGTIICAASGAGLQCDATEEGEAELCDGQDNDCDGEIDEDLAYASAPLGFACTGPGVCSAEEGTVVCGTNHEAVCSTMPFGVPGEILASSEICNQLDDDCDGKVDETFFDDDTPFGSACEGAGACGTGTWECAPWFEAICSTSAGGSDPSHQTAEDCNGLDDDCDGETDEHLDGATHLSDCRLNGVCTLGNVVATCDEGATEGWTCIYDGIAGYVSEEDGKHCDGIDNDCDGETDEPFTEQLGQPCDGNDNDDCEDGVLVCDASDDKLLCTDDEAFSYEICGDGIDNDCNGETDEPDALGCQDWCHDSDGDGSPPDHPTDAFFSHCECRCAPNAHYTLLRLANDPTDCAPEDGTIHPGAPEKCNGVDDDCDGAIDADDGLDLEADDPQPCANTFGVCGGIDRTAELCVDGGWLECDDAFFVAELGFDFEAGAETSCDGLDNDCDGETDEAEALLPVACELDEGVCSGAYKPLSACVDGGWAPCVDADYIAHAGTDYHVDGETSCDGLDNDCDGLTDEGFFVNDPCVAPGVCGAGILECAGVGDDTQCSSIALAVDETCDNLDNDCDGETDEGPFPETLCPHLGACEGKVNVGCAEGGSLLCDVYATEYEIGTEETCDGVDNDCDGETDEDFLLYMEGLSQPLKKGDLCDTTECDDEDEGGDAFVVCHPNPTPGNELICSSTLNGLVEVCDGVDNDCDAATDEGFADKDYPCDGDDDDLCTGGVWVCSRDGTSL